MRQQWNLMRAAYEANPELIGKETSFTQPDSVYRILLYQQLYKAGSFKGEMVILPIAVVQWQIV